MKTSVLPTLACFALLCTVVVQAQEKNDADAPVVQRKLFWGQLTQHFKDRVSEEGNRYFGRENGLLWNRIARYGNRFRTGAWNQNPIYQSNSNGHQSNSNEYESNSNGYESNSNGFGRQQARMNQQNN